MSRAAPGPALSQHAAWSLCAGAVDVPWVQRAGRCLLGLSLCFMLAWAASVWWADWVRQRLEPASLLALPVLLVGLLWWRSLWSGWHEAGPRFTLSWRAPGAACQAARWCVDLWPDREADVKVVADLQRCMLLRIAPLTPMTPPPATGRGRGQRQPLPIWAWVPDAGDAHTHRLRTLVHLPVNPGPAAGAAPAVRLQRPRRARHPSADDGFAPTVWMPREGLTAKGPGAKP